jgi:nicotinate-nucleotide adenylyltransferase
MAGLIGVFGGTFDPPHLGHLILAAEACEQLRLERLLWVLTPDPPHKRDRAISPLEQRIAMLELAIAGEPCFELSRVDMDRPAPHYAVDTVRLLRAAHPKSELAYLVGGDSLAYLPSWYRPTELVAAVDILGVMRRPGAEIDLSSLEAQVPGLTARVRWIDAPLLEISSSDIRQRICQFQTFRYFLPPPVYEFIQLNQLYL